MDSQTSPSISPVDLYGAIGIAGAPVVIDVRRNAAFAADNQMIAGAVRRDPDDIKNWREELPPKRAVVVYCVHGREVSQQAASTLRSAGIDARYLEHGISGWAEHRLPMRSKRDNEARSWVTRERPKIDRIACPWLIRRFIDPEAEFLFVPTERVFSVASETGATAYDIPGVRAILARRRAVQFRCLSQSLRHQGSCPRHAGADRARCRYSSPRARTAIAGPACLVTRTLGQFPGRPTPCSGTAW